MQLGIVPGEGGFRRLTDEETSEEQVREMNKENSSVLEMCDEARP